MAGSTVSMFLQLFNTQAQARTLLREFRIAYGEITDLNERSIELAKGQALTLAAENFMVFLCTEQLPVTITTYHKDNSNAWVANSPQAIFIQGIFSFPGKISISINNPSDNPSDLPYTFKAVHS